MSMWGTDLKSQRSLKTGTDSCKTRDLWVTHFVPLQNVNKIALAFTSKEIGEDIYLEEEGFMGCDSDRCLCLGCGGGGVC